MNADIKHKALSRLTKYYAKLVGMKKKTCPAIDKIKRKIVCEYILIIKQSPLLGILCGVSEQNWLLKTKKNIFKIVNQEQIGININGFKRHCKAASTIWRCETKVMLDFCATLEIFEVASFESTESPILFLFEKLKLWLKLRAKAWFHCSTTTNDGFVHLEFKTLIIKFLWFQCKSIWFQLTKQSVVSLCVSFKSNAKSVLPHTVTT